jgi:hypothetical protein
VSFHSIVIHQEGTSVVENLLRANLSVLRAFVRETLTVSRLT